MAIFGNIHKKKTGVLPYVLLLLLAIIVLFYISYISFQQNKALRESTELVSHTQDVINEINMLFTNYSSSESAGIKYLISNDSTYLNPIQDFSDKSGVGLKNLRELMAENEDQMKQLNRLPTFSEKLFEEIRSFDEKTAKIILQSKTLRERIRSIEGHLDSLETIQNAMIQTELALLKKQKEAYESNVTLTPANTLYSILFALGILMFAFSRINSDRKKLAATREFLHNVLENTSNIIIYLKPLRDENDTITDFRIEYINSRIEEVTDKKVKRIIGRNLSESKQFSSKKGMLAFLANTLEKNEATTQELDYTLNGQRLWFNSSFTPSEDGLIVTSRNSTSEKNAEKKLLKLNEQLETQNIELDRTGGFLRNILASFQYVISYFEAIRGDNDKIIDFKIIYTNDKIVELTGETAEIIEGKLVSEVYPFVMENGDFETYIEAIRTGKLQEVEREYDLEKGQFTFCNEIVKLEDGVTILSQDITKRKEAETNLLKLNEALEVQNTILSDAEIVAGIGSYKWNITADKMEYSDNSYRLFGYEPGAFVPSYDKFLSFVHPADAERMEGKIAKTLERKEQTESTYRIITKEGDTKHISSMGHFLEKNGDTFMVGVMRDVTSKVADEIKLTKKNRELQRSNAELESFNRVASHDLQEPLRKIQMFISRLSEVDKKSISEKGQKYLDKIESSAGRMQLLIQNLLSYSRISNEVEKQHKIDLNYIFDKVLEDLAEKIKETKAEISIPELPVIYGTEFQLEQLFNNLLSNSIKYKKHDQTPEIEISSEIVSFEQINSSFNLQPSRYLLVNITDNGVGFDQQQSDKIFELFERLHAKHAYTGTGLGLAICKKIVENHNGHISAHSEPGQGTQMKIYLPYKR